MKFKNGDMVKVMSGSTNGQHTYSIGEIVESNRDGAFDYLVSFEDGCNELFDEENLILAEKFLENISEGDVIDCFDGDEKTVLAICGKVIFLSRVKNPSKLDNGYTRQEIQERGWKIKQEMEEETIEIDGESYDKGQLLKAMKKLQKKK